MSDTIGLQHLMVVEPLELEILATLIKDKHTVRIVDMILEKKELTFFLNDFQPDVLCITGYITHIPVIIRYCQQAKEFNKDIITITGGVHVEKFPEDIDHESVDFRVVRNATISFPQLISFISEGAHFPAGVLKTNEVLIDENLPDYDFFYPVPDRSLTANYRKKYFYVFHNKVALVKTSFGCPYKCNFCFCRKITGDRYFARPLIDVIDEIAGIKENEIYIVDDDFLVNAKRIREFIYLLNDRGIKKKFLVYGRADFIAGNPDIIRDFKKAGLRTIIVGLESFDDNELNDFNKQTTSSTNKFAMDVLNRNSVDCYAAVIVSPSWDESHFKRAGDIMIKLGIKFVNLQPLTPLKGTGIIVEDKDLVVDRKDYAKWDLAHVTIKPEKLSLKDFYTNILKLYLRILNHHLLYFLRYPIKRQWIMAIGLRKVIRQYKQRIMEVS
jgi:hopanoid C-3 methylase